MASRRAPIRSGEIRYVRQGHLLVPVDDEVRARREFRDDIGAWVDGIRDLESRVDSIKGKKIPLARVPPEVAERLRVLACQLACVAFFETAPAAFIEHAQLILDMPHPRKKAPAWKYALKEVF